jgi:glutamine amidotransferase
MIEIINYGLGNLNSIVNIIKKIGGECRIINSPDEISGLHKLILPGVGAFDHGMKELISQFWVEKLNEVVLEKKIPILGICLGMQLMCKSSEEGSIPGLGWINADVIKFKKDESIGLNKVPHMGWNTVSVLKENKLLPISDIERRFYFVHSYFVKANEAENKLSETSYGVNFTSSFSKGNIFGAQFHPEKSHKFGMELLSNYTSL